VLHSCSMIGRATVGGDGASIPAVWFSAGPEPIAAADPGTSEGTP